jgi:Domain of unknown function (DUF4383)
MAHFPVNHPSRPFYRVLSGLAGIYLVVLGIVGLIVTSGDGLFGTAGHRVLGQGANLFWSIVSLIAGVIVVAATALGGNVLSETDKYIGWGLLVVGTFALAVARTDANVLDFSVATVVVTFLVGLVLILAGLYSKVAPPQEAGTPRQVREDRPV